MRFFLRSQQTNPRRKASPCLAPLPLPPAWRKRGWNAGAGNWGWTRFPLIFWCFNCQVGIIIFWSKRYSEHFLTIFHGFFKMFFAQLSVSAQKMQEWTCPKCRRTEEKTSELPSWSKLKTVGSETFWTAHFGTSKSHFLGWTWPQNRWSQIESQHVTAMSLMSWCFNLLSTNYPLVI